MAAPILPAARTVARPTWRDWAQVAWLALISIGVPIAIRLLVPPRTAWIGWALHLVPLVVWAAVLVPLVRGGGSPWLAVRDPARPADARRTIYVALDVILVVGYLFVFARLMPNRHAWASMLMELLPLGTYLLAIGTLIAWRLTWWVAAAGALIVLAWLVGAMSIVLYFSTYLAGVYGGFGKASSVGTLISLALLVELVALVPALQMKWAMTRRGRRSFGLPPVARPAAAATGGAAA